MVEGKNNNFVVGIIIAICGIIILSILTVVYINNDNFPLWQLLMWGFIIIAGFIAVFFIFKYFQDHKNEKLENKKDEKLPPAITLEQAKEIALASVRNPNFADYASHCLDEGTWNFGKNKKNTIYRWIGKGKYEGGIYVILINMHYPNTLKAVIPMSISAEEFLLKKQDLINSIKREAMLLALEPEDDIPIKTTIHENPLLGTSAIITEPVVKEEKTEEKKEE